MEGGRDSWEVEGPVKVCNGTEMAVGRRFLSLNNSQVKDAGAK